MLLRLALALALGLVVSGFAAADNEERCDHDCAAALVQSGEIASLPQILRTLAGRLGGEVIEVELEREGGLWFYELKVIDPQGRIVEWYVDARDGRPIESEREE